MLNFLQSLAILLGRFALCLIFILGAVEAYSYPGEIVGDVKSLGSRLQDPEQIGLMVNLSVALQLLGGVSVLLGCLARVGALLLIAFLAAVSVLFHRFDYAAVTVADPVATAHLMACLRNLSICGGLLLIVGGGAGSWSLDALWTHLRAKRSSAAPAPATSTTP